MYQIKLKLNYWWSKFIIQRNYNNVNKQVSSGGIIWPLFTFLFKALILCFFGMLILFPFYYMISIALMTKDETRTTDINLVPATAQWENFNQAMIAGYWDAVLITAIVTALSIVIKVMVTMLMGYAFSLRNWRFKKLVWTFFIMLLMIPEVALLYGQYKVIVDLNLQVGYQIIIALFLPFIASVFSAFMFRNAFEAIPSRIKEAAFVDGTRPIKYFVKIAMPMVIPTTWTVAILTGFAAWNSYIWPTLLLSGTSFDVINTWLFKTGMEGFGGDSRVMMNVRMAAAILAILPMFFVYFVFRTRIMRAISRQGSAIKG